MKAFTVIFVLMLSAVLLADIPEPKSFYDFEETEGPVIDQGAAANHGEIVDPSGWVSRNNSDGVYAKPTDGRGCIEFVEENAFGELCYVRIPYNEFMKSLNYTYSVWMQYVGAPNWGYLFWADGKVWEPEVTDRQVDVWLNPGNNGADCILNLEDGTTLRVASKAAECGIELMDNLWHQVTVTLAEGVFYKLYIDGILCAEGEAAAPVVVNGGDDLWLGARPNNADATTAVKIVGLMDRVRIWDVALDPAQVELLFNMEGPSGGTVGVAQKPAAPQAFGLLSNYPNPFNPSTTISYSLDKTEQVSLEVYDMLGHKVSTLFSGTQSAGQYHVVWDGLNDNGQPAMSGLYIYTLKAGHRSDYGKMTLLK